MITPKEKIQSQMARLNQFKYNIPSLTLIGKEKTFRYNRSTSETPSNSLTEFSFATNGTENGYISHQTPGVTNWNTLQEIECLLPTTHPLHSRALTFPFGGCTWIFGITANSISAFRDNHPFSDFRDKTDNLFGRFDRVLRLEHLENIPGVKRLLTNQQLARVQFQEYAVPRMNTPWPTTAVAYAEFLSDRWRLFIQDTYPVVIKEQFDHVPQLNRNFRHRLIA